MLPLAAAACLGASALATAGVQAHDHGAGSRYADPKDPMVISERYNATLSHQARSNLLPGLAVPFPCGQTWTGSTRASHSPSVNSVDFNSPNDEGKPVVASAAGTVTTAYRKPYGGYGRWVVVDHGNGTSTLYAHLKSVLVVPGQTVDQGALLGAVGSSGNSTGPHLHYEQKQGRVVTAPAFAGKAYKYGSITSGNCADLPLAGDFTGDGMAEVAVHRRGVKPSFVVPDHEGDLVITFGGPIAEPLVGDWDGDGLADVGIRAPRARQFQLRTHAGVRKLRCGKRVDRAVVGDWDGVGADQVGIYRPGTGRFRLRLANGKVRVITLGDRNDLPVTGDFDGDGRTDVGVYDPATSRFTLRTQTANGKVSLQHVSLGSSGDLPVVADWDGDGIDDLGVWTPATATFTLQVPQAPGSGRVSLSTIQFGRAR
jgi:hypothetical protein